MSLLYTTRYTDFRDKVPLGFYIPGLIPGVGLNITVGFTVYSNLIGFYIYKTPVRNVDWFGF